MDKNQNQKSKIIILNQKGRIKKLKKFFYMNKFLLISQSLLIFSIFAYKITLAPVLIQYFNFTETLLSYSNIIFSIGWFLGILFINELFKYKFNTISMLKYLTFFVFLFGFCEFLLIYFSTKYNILQYFYLANRFFEGLFNQILFSVIGNLLTYKLVFNKQNGTINGVINSINMLIKFLAPTVGSLFIISIFPLLNMFFIIFISLILFFIFNLNEEKLLREYHRYLLKKITRNKIKLEKISFNFFKTSLNMKEIYTNFFLHKHWKKNYFLSSILLNSSTRNFFDLYFILYLTTYYKLNITERTFIFSFTILGFSMQFITGYLADIFNYLKIQLFSYFVSIGIFCSLLFYQLNYFELIIISFILGVIRSIKSNWEYKMSIKEYENFKISLESNRRFLKLNIEMGNIFGYLICSFLFFYFSFNSLIIYYIVVYILLISIHTYYFILIRKQ